MPVPDPGAPAPSIGLILRTISRLPPKRVALRLARPLRGSARRLAHALGTGPGAARFASPALTEDPVPGRTLTPPSTFAFVGISRDLGSPIDWGGAPTRLWAYHLHSLDALREGHDADARLALLDRWVEGNAFGSRPGWEAYPTSLRLVNALELLASRRDAATAARTESLALQAWWLAANLETDLGGNHLLKNAFALSWAGRCLDTRDSNAWRTAGDSILARELPAQILADGFHVERAPGYHAVLVDDLTRLDRLLRARGEATEAFGQLIAGLRERTAAALASVLHPDGEIPLFNDSAAGQAPPSAWLLGRAAAPEGPGRIAADRRGAPAAGFHRLDGERSVVLFDAGEIGDGDQPGHAHADTLSYELSFGTTRVAVDAGVFDYGNNALRGYARGTRAHNTVEIDGRDQSEMWSVFRVGRRAHPLDVRRDGGDGPAFIEAGHDGYTQLSGRPIHRRRMEHLGHDVWRVLDVIEGAGSHTAVSRVRLAPSLAIVAHGTDRLEAADATCRVRIVAEQPASLSLEEGEYFPRFGERRVVSVARMEARGPLPLTLRYRLELETRS